MKLLLRLFTTFCALFCTELFAGNLKVNLSPAAVVSAGAQWRVDGGAWKNSGATVNNLSNSAHTVDYKAITGWVTPASSAVTLVSGQTTTLTTTYVQTSGLKITLTPTSGQWRIDGVTWRTSGTTVTGLTPGNHTIDYLAVTGYASPATETVALTAGQTTALARSYTQLAQIAVTLTPTTGQWRVDGGAWRNSGTTAANLPIGSHTIDYNALAGYASPASETVTLTAGQNLPISRSYIKLAQLKVTLTPNTAQWRIDGGAWRSSGTTTTNLSVGSHTIDYAALNGYAAPASESVTLSSGQSLSLNRSYTQLAQLSVTLSPASGQWRVDGGTWQASGATVSNLAIGSHTISYAPVTNYASPATEAITLTTGQSLNLARSYLQLAQISVTLTPSSGQWRVDGGAWQNSGTTVSNLPLGLHTIGYSVLDGYIAPNDSEYDFSGGLTNISSEYTLAAQVSITLVPATGQWRVNVNGDEPWQPSGATVFAPPEGAPIEYSELPEYDSPGNETITLPPGGSFTGTRYYTSLKPTLRVNLTPYSGPWVGKWRVDGGVWQNNGATASDLAVGTHTVDYADIGGPYTPLPSETISLSLRENATLARSYSLKPPAALTITLDPTTAQWRVDGGAWQASGATATLPYDAPLVVEYSAVTGYSAPASESVTIASGQTLSLVRSYIQLPRLSVTLMPVSGEWSVDGGASQASGTTVGSLTPGSHTISYKTLNGYASPAAETVSLSLGQTLPLSRNYTQLAEFYVILNPTSAQWRIDGGIWTAGGIDFPRGNLSLGNHTVEYSAVPGYVTPPSETVTLVGGANTPLARSYIPLASFSVTLTPSSAQWRLIDSQGTSPWFASGTLLPNLPLGERTVEFSAVTGFITPPSETITLVSGTNPSLTRTYSPLASLSVTLNPASAQWRLVDAQGASMWFASGTTLPNLPIGNYTIEYSFVSGYITPSAETITMVSGPNGPLDRSYIPEAPAFAQIHAFTDLGSGFTMTPGSDGKFYGVAYSGGGRARGYVFKMNGDGSGLESLYAFGTQPNDGLGAQSLTEGRDGILYGTTDTHGSSSITNKGIIFKVNKDGTGYTILHTYVSSLSNQGSTPIAILDGSDGSLYGATAAGGNGSGVIFRMNKDGTNYTIIRYFVGSEGTSPKGLLEGPGAVLYGVTATSLFRMNLDGSNFTVLKSLPAGGTDGASPRSGMILGTDGKLYGTTSTGGTANRGVVYRLNQDGSNYQVLHHFLGGATDGLGPWASLTETPDGRLVGTTLSGGASTRGTLFILNKDGSNYAVLKHFTANGDDGGLPKQQVLVTNTGALCSTNTSGGATGRGLMFTINPDGTGFSVLSSLGAPEGSLPMATVTEASNGMFYGTTYTGGTKSVGTLFQMNKDGTNYSVLHHFGMTADDGGSPRGQLLEGSDGQIYGTGAALFTVNKDGTGYALIHIFGTGTDGSAPWDSVIEASDGKLYGTTVIGGTGGGYGTVYRVNKDGTNYGILHNFSSGATDGDSPAATVIEGSDGRLYGSTTGGGSTGSGTVYVINKDGTGYSIIRHFSGGVGDGAVPSGRFLQCSNGRLYGTTSNGGANGLGTLFRLNLDGSGYEVLKHFAGGTGDGAKPYYCTLIEKNGLLYGVTSEGGTFNGGILYSLNLDGSGFAVLINFGAGPLDTLTPTGLINADDGYIYGTNAAGAGGGSIFRFRTN